MPTIAGPLLGRFASTAANPAFGVAAATGSSLATAVVQCVSRLQQQLGAGRTPHFCQILVHSEQGTTAALASAFLREILTTPGHPTPVIIGGVIQGLIGASVTQTPPAGYQVSIAAAHLPGVHVEGFHVANPSLPDLSPECWQHLTATGAVKAKHRSSVALLLVEPTFTMVGMLAQRLGRWMPVVGGVVKSHSWGAGQSLRGSVMLNGQAYDHGAVGAVLTGPQLQVKWAHVPSCLPVGKAMTVTRTQGNWILDLDHLPARAAVISTVVGGAAASQTHAETMSRQLMVGLKRPDEPSAGGFMMHSITGSQQDGPGIEIDATRIQEGSTVQFHLLDQIRCRDELDTFLQDSDGQDSCTMMYKSNMLQLPSRVPEHLQGAMCMAEVAPCSTLTDPSMDTQAALQSFSAAAVQLQLRPG